MSLPWPLKRMIAWALFNSSAETVSMFSILEKLEVIDSSITAVEIVDDSDGEEVGYTRFTTLGWVI